MGAEELGAGTVPSGHALAYLFGGVGIIAGADQGPPAHDARHRPVEVQAVLSGESDGLVRELPGARPLTAKLVQDGREDQCVRQSMRFGQLPPERYGFGKSPEGAIGLAHEPQ
jgi:hypothetical protein